MNSHVTTNYRSSGALMMAYYHVRNAAKFIAMGFLGIVVLLPAVVVAVLFRKPEQSFLQRVADGPFGLPVFCLGVILAAPIIMSGKFKSDMRDA